MKISLRIAAGSGAPTTFEHAGPVIRIGRDADCELSLQGDATVKVSRQHARIELGAGGATLTDVGSSNGTLINDKPLKGTAPLRLGDRIQLGYTGATLTVRELDLDAPPVGKAARIPPVLWIGSGVAVALVVALIIGFWPRQPKEPAEVASSAPGAERDGSSSGTQVTAPVPVVPDFEPLSRGEVHEAFAQPIDYQAQPGPVVPRKPPDFPDELPPEQKPEGEDVQWLPGYWAWDDECTDYVWVSGFWRNAPPRRHWVPGAWQEVEGGWMWSAGFWADDENQAVSYVSWLPLPDETSPPERPSQPTDIYVPGCWVWQEADWFWRPGYWMSPKPGWVWVMARYIWTPGGYVFVDGYWDRPLEKRGLLLAPVRVSRRSVVDWTYVARDVVRVDFLLRALFVGPGRRHYHFGDYFAGSYAQRGFVPFASDRPTRWSNDPIYNHYRQFFSDNPAWERDFRTYAQKGPALTRLERGREESVTRIAGLAPSATKAPAFEIKTHRLRPEDRADEREQIRHAHRVAEVRRQHEPKLLEKGAGPGSPAQHPKAAPLELPRSSHVRQTPVMAARPPIAPRAVPRPHPIPVPSRSPGPPRRR